jgi:hypothetical protein
LADYLLWWTQKQAVPVATNVGLPEFTLPDNNPHNGARLTIGTWVNPSRTLALEVGGFWLDDRATTTTVVQGANPNAVNLPFFLGIDNHTSSLRLSTQLWGAEVNGRCKACEKCGTWCKGYVDFLAGFRYVNLSEGLVLTNSTLFSVAPVLFSGAQVDSIDSAVTHNNFYAPQVGVDAGVDIGRFNVSVYTKVALGINQETVNLTGLAVVTAPPLPLGNLTAPGGLLVQSPGRFNQQVFSYLPEAGINFSFKVCDFCLVGAGYTFFYFGNVVRPSDHLPASTTGNQFPTSILTQLGAPPTSQPPFSFHQTNFWAQGGDFRITFIF